MEKIYKQIALDHGMLWTIFETLFLRFTSQAFSVISKMLWKNRFSSLNPVCEKHDHHLLFREAYTEPCQTSKLELFGKIANGWKQLTIFAKSSILVVYNGADAPPLCVL